MTTMNIEEELKICVCRICLDSNCVSMVQLDELGWLSLFEYCFGFVLTKQDKPRVICKSCADSVKSFSKFKDQCQKSDSLWKSMTADVKCSIPKFKHKEVFQRIEQNREPTNLDLKNKNENFDIACDNDSNIHTESNVDILFTEIKFESDNDIQKNEQEPINDANIIHMGDNVQKCHLKETVEVNIETNEASIENVCKNNSSKMQEGDLKQKCMEETKQHFNTSVKSDLKEFYRCTMCKKKYTKKKWYLIHIEICKSNNYKSNLSDMRNGSWCDSKNIAIDNNSVVITNNNELSEKCVKDYCYLNRNQDDCLLHCGLCKYNCTSIDNLCKHLDEHWLNNDLDCKLCEYVGEDLAAVTVHRFSHFPVKWKKRFLCHICQQLKYSKLSLHFHYRLIHLKKSGGFCLRCNKEFKRLKTWRIHERSHVTPGYICDICGKNFAYKYIIKNHLMNHTNPGQHICDVCGKMFKRSTHLQIHMKSVHVTTGPLKCTHCNRMFKSQHTLSLHQKTLAREKPYKCEICLKGYHTPTFLKSHMAKHSDERPHCCDICGSRYKAKSQLKVHMRKHTGYMPFKCVACSKEFATSSQLKVHSSVHTGVRPYSCTHCSRTFHSRKLLLSHNTVQHKNEIVKNCDL